MMSYILFMSYRIMFQCQKCPEMQRREEDIKIHVLAKHFIPQEVPYLCKLCQARKLSYGAAKTHKKFKHPSESMSVKEMFAGNHTKEKMSLIPEYYCRMEGSGVHTSEKRKLVQEADTAEEVPSCQGQTKRCKIATHSAPATVPHLLDMPCHPDDIVDLSVVGQDTEFTSPIEDIGDVTNVTQQETRRADNQQDRLVTVLRTKLVNVEKELRHERERCAILERSRNRKVAELFTKEQQRMGKQVSPLLTLDVVNGAHKRIPLKQREELQQVPRRGNQGTVTKNKENTKTKTIHGTQRRLKQDYKRH